MTELLVGRRHPSGWQTDRFLAGDLVVELAVYPLDDLIEHEIPGDGCPCGPSSELQTGRADADGDVWMHTHHALDGRA